MSKNTPKTQEVINNIEADLARGISQRKIAAAYGVCQSYVSGVKAGIAKPLVTEAKIIQPQADPTDSKILELESKIISLQDERNRLSKAYKAAQRKNSIFEAVVDEMKTVVTPISPLPKIPRKKRNGKRIHESCVLLLSDMHADTVVAPENVNGLERYNFGIACRRGEQLVDSTINFTQSTLKNYNFDNLYVFANGDHVSGEIHGAVEHSQYRNIFKNCLAVGQLQALMFRDLARYFPGIHIIYTPGNHGRRSLKKDYHGAHDNFDYLVAEIARLHCQDIKNVDFLIPDSFSANIEIRGHGFCVSHGDSVRSWGGLPWYGLTRKVAKWSSLNASIDRKIKYYLFSHFHQAATLPNLNGEVIINGAWLATDPYAFDAITAWSEPSQWLFGVHHNHGISWRLKVNLKTERESLGPTRYSPLTKMYNENLY